MLDPSSTQHFDDFSQPVLVVEYTHKSLNHKLVYQNKSFIKAIGWTLDEIPDKEHWWQKAYPDPQYQKVVENLWEIEMESIDLNADEFVVITVNIMTKHNKMKRFEVRTELKSSVTEGYYAVIFDEVNTA
ncbi:hypothetical protein [Litorilituus lipolyticus]|uniref:PAS domain-containing protein n=1 Tax=Litorilituus lipolyticus TaxID=2491017 RepID=A0A502KZN8_9GAMM|nr:hypothetical protein [Litorilituus lipolyticus]TPH15133.1 hypothetical protein EPA86_09960 [Litorilituus lipolyticus]